MPFKAMQGLWHTFVMAAFPGIRAGGWAKVRAIIFSLWVAGFVSGAGDVRAQDAGAMDAGGVTPTLHVYTNLVQVPVLVLASNRQRLSKTIDPSRFAVNVDSGPWFKATHVRKEGDDAISLAILLDLHGDAADLMGQMDEALASLAPASLNESDRVSIYALDCRLLLGAMDLPATAKNLRLGAQGVLAAWKTRGKTKSAPRCLQEAYLRDALGYILKALTSARGRRVVLAVTDGKDSASKQDWIDIRTAAQIAGTAVFGVVAYPGLPLQFGVPASGRDRRSAEDPFNAMCELSGGMVVRASAVGLKSVLERFTTTVRERYIVEFPRPSNSTPGRHTLTVKVEKEDDFIRTAGATIPMPDASVLADPTTISAGPSNAPVQGERRVLDGK